jgi:hypothetical protein
MATVIAAMSGVPFIMQAAATSGNGNVVAVPMSWRNHTFIVTGTGTVSTGAITIETGTDPTLDTGTWALVPATGAAGTIANPVTILSATDLMLTITGIFQFFRARLSTAVTGAGGSVTVTYIGGKSF